MSAEFKQTLQNVIFNDLDGKDVTIVIQAIGIEGNLRDHFIMMKYVAALGEPQMEQDLLSLQNLYDSFRPLRIFNKEKRMDELADLADEKFLELVRIKGNEIFQNEFNMLLNQIRDVDLNSPESRLRVIKKIRPFEVLASKVGFQSEEHDKLWKALHEAETGNAEKLKASLQKFQTAHVEGSQGVEN